MALRSLRSRGSGLIAPERRESGAVAESRTAEAFTRNIAPGSGPGILADRARSIDREMGPNGVGARPEAHFVE